VTLMVDGADEDDRTAIRPERWRAVVTCHSVLENIDDYRL